MRVTPDIVREFHSASCFNFVLSSMQAVQMTLDSAITRKRDSTRASESKRRRQLQAKFEIIKDLLFDGTNKKITKGDVLDVVIQVF